MSSSSNISSNKKSPLPSFLRNTDASGKKIAISEIKNIPSQIIKAQGTFDNHSPNADSTAIYFDYIVVFLQPDDLLCIMGSCDFCLYAGTIDVQGLSLLEPTPQFYSINSPPHASSLSFQPHSCRLNAKSNNNSNCSIMNNAAKKILPDNIIACAENLIEKNKTEAEDANKSFSVLIFKENKATVCLSKAVEARSWFQRSLLSNYSSTSSIMHGFALMLPTNHETSRKTVTKYLVKLPQLWEATVNTIISSVLSSESNRSKEKSSIDSSSTILVCGAKNVGKSTLGRYLVNRLLSSKRSTEHTKNPDSNYMASNNRNDVAIAKVAYIDTDLGQTEFTPPGFVSLFLLSLSEPMIGPAMPFWRQPVLSYYIGDVTPRSFPNMYLAAVQNLVKQYHELKLQDNLGCNLPLVLNTMGWVKGMGLDLLNEIISFSRPRHIFQIVGNSEKKRFSLVIPQTQQDYQQQQQGADGNISCNSSNNSDTIRVHKVQTRNDNKHVRNSNNTNNSNNNNGKDNEAKKNGIYIPSRTAKELREEQICTYFAYMENSPNLDFSNLVYGDIVEHLVNQHPYKIHWNSIAVSFQFDCGDEIGTLSGTDLFDALNGTIVGLGVLDQIDLSTSKSILRLKGSPLCRSVGLGIIRGIDYDRKIYYVLSPISEKNLKKVNVFIRGKLNCPVKMIQWRSCPVEIPYLTSETVQSRSQQKSNIRGMKRRRLNQ